MEKIIIHHRSAHHAQNSGYGILADYLKGRTLPYLDSKFPYALAKQMAKLFDQKAGNYDTISFIKEYELLKQLIAFQKKNGIVHYLNGERDIRLSIALNSYLKKYKFIATFHKPPEILREIIPHTKYLKKLNGAIAVGKNQVDFLKNWLDLENVKFIPHGVDTVFFKPDASKRKENTVLFVGQHLRDFDALNYAIPRLKAQNPKVKINAVLRKDFANKIVPNDAVTVFSELDDDSLRTLYQEATLLFLPLKNATACNSILEAMACGLPIISTDVSSNADYVKNEAGVLVPHNDYKALVDETVSLLKDIDKQLDMSKKAKATSLDFEWGKVALEIESFYKEIM
ncbi:glycosyltransferase family 4 protein [Flavobacterium maritimum]|uniref:glycosyltransferase family 4 protein n=1 Tax=Flavobacterium maritimum TaxID=3149042 RepID=UPI0032B4A76A